MKGVFEHLKDKNIREGVHVYVQAGLAKITVPPAITFLAALSPSLTTARISRSKSETWSMRGDCCKRHHFPFAAQEIRFLLVCLGFRDISKLRQQLLGL